MRKIKLFTLAALASSYIFCGGCKQSMRVAFLEKHGSDASVDLSRLNGGAKNNERWLIVVTLDGNKLLEHVQQHGSTDTHYSSSTIMSDANLSTEFEFKTEGMKDRDAIGVPIYNGDNVVILRNPFRGVVVRNLVWGPLELSSKWKKLDGLQSNQYSQVKVFAIRTPESD